MPPPTCCATPCLLLLQGKVTETPQDESKATYFGRRTPADGKLVVEKPAEELFNLVRAVTQPYPGAFCAVGEHKLIVWSAEGRGNEGQRRAE
jgi:UDP-4-amino-4-deoxy-L-arabinose formyltransferase/UDP-glucuronic acid dehydrogenase (UDP-4-keto-hexauronic acid decarboxylating)